MKERKVLLHITDLKQYFPIGKKSYGKKIKYVKANDGISIDIYEGETFGLVGESGCGKSTFGRTILQLNAQTGGRTIYYGRTVEDAAPKYIEDIFRNLTAKRNECKELRKKADELKKVYEDLKRKRKSDEDAAAEIPGHLYENYQNAEKAYNNLFLDVTGLIGGLYVADNLDEIQKVYQAEYQATADRRVFKGIQNKLKIKYDATVVDLSEKGKSKAEIEAATATGKARITAFGNKIAKKDEEIDELTEKIKRMKAKHKSHPDFDKYEANIDSGINLANLSIAEMRGLRNDLQFIFQDPYSSLDARMTTGQIIGEGLLAHKIYQKNNKEMQEYVLEVMDKCGLSPYFIHRYPHQFSGGQRQRIGIARSLAMNPKFVVCDEVVSALDVSIQSQIVNLLLDLKEQNELTYLFISHDLSVIKYISDRIGVMYLGNMVELSTTKDLFENTAHPYTEALLSAIPTIDLDSDKEAVILEGDIPSPINPPKGCKFHTRCNYCTDICKKVNPLFEEISSGHFVACHHKRTKKKEA